MKIIVTIKQVPEANKVAVNPETGTLIREGVESILNPFCEYALDMAVKLKIQNPDLNVEIIVISMGPPQAKYALIRCLELGADKAYLLSDRAFSGSDVWATALTLKEGILKKIETTNNPNYNISCPVFVFESEKKESFLIQIIADLEREIYQEEEK